jgi:hypothetical protein
MIIEYSKWRMTISGGRYSNVGRIVLQVDLPGVAEPLTGMLPGTYSTSYTRSDKGRSNDIV